MINAIKIKYIAFERNIQMNMNWKRYNVGGYIFEKVKSVKSEIGKTGNESYFALQKGFGKKLLSKNL